jgi:ATP-dependent DNA ligase
VPEVFTDGTALFQAVCEQELEGVVAKRRGERYRPGERAWVKTKEPGVLAVRTRARGR